MYHALHIFLRPDPRMCAGKPTPRNLSRAVRGRTVDSAGVHPHPCPVGGLRHGSLPLIQWLIARVNIMATGMAHRASHDDKTPIRVVRRDNAVMVPSLGVRRDSR